MKYCLNLAFLGDLFEPTCQLNENFIICFKKKDVVALLQVPRHHLGIYADPRGFVSGCLRIRVCFPLKLTETRLLQKL